MKGLAATFLSAVCFVAATASNVVDLTPDNFDSVVLSGKPSFVEFFAPWCGHCKSLAPVYEQLADSYVSKDVTIAKVDCDQHKKLAQRFKIKGFPTLKYFDGKSETPTDYDKQRDLGSMQSFISSKSGFKAKVKREVPSEVVVLTDSNFAEVVNGDKHVLVEFYAPWCGHCKSLAPIYEQLAHTFSSEPDVVIAKIDADAANGKASAAKYGVSGFPTLKFFPKGSTEPIDYSAARKEEAFVKFLNEKASTLRKVGGGLLPEAGVIPEFTAALKRLVKGDASSLAAVTEEIKKLATSTKHTSNAIYLKALEKLGSNGEYIEKEIARLGRMLENSDTLARNKIDELTIKKNVLESFHLKGHGDADAVKDEL